MKITLPVKQAFVVATIHLFAKHMRAATIAHRGELVLHALYIFAHIAVKASLGQSVLANTAFAALQQARLRVLPHHIAWVVELIGHVRARQCLSLPRAVRMGRVPAAADDP